jgi:hypothetical protein
MTPALCGGDLVRSKIGQRSLDRYLQITCSLRKEATPDHAASFPGGDLLLPELMPSFL